MKFFCSFLLLLIFQVGENATAQTIQLGNGTSITNYAAVSPVNNYYSNERIQYLFTASELNALGIVGPYLIDSIGFNVVVAPASALPAYTVKMAGTVAPDLSTPFSGTFTTVYTTAAYTPMANYWNMIGLQNNFAWNGTDNIVVEICFGPATTGSTASGTVQYTATTGMGRYYMSNTLAACAQTLSATTNYRPNTKLHFSSYPPCTGTPSILMQTTSPLNVCMGSTPTLVANVNNAGGLSFQWEKSVAANGPWLPIAGANNLFYSFPATVTAYYRLAITCPAGATVSGSAIQVNVTPVSYSSLPYVQDFESWQNYCDTADIPDINWTNQPAHYNNSWRRNDKGATAGWYNPASGLYNVAATQVAKSGVYSARFHSYGTLANTPPTTIPGNLDMYLNCSASAMPKALYFWYNNSYYTNYNGDSLKVLLSTDGGTSFTSIAAFDTSTTWVRKFVPVISSSAQTVLRFQGKRTASDYSDILIDSVYVAPSCSGQPVAGNIIPSGTFAGCPGDFFTFNAAASTMVGNLSYTWQQKSAGSNTWAAVTGVVSNNGFTFTTSALYDTTQYRLIVTCLGSNLSDTSQVATVNIIRPVSAGLPFTEDFENWGTRCFTTDIPGNCWVNYPTRGNNSWRRDDQGASAGWTSATTGLISPFSFSGAHSARFHGYSAASGTAGLLDLYLDCSTVAGIKELQFYLKTHTSAVANDSMNILLSTDGGNSFTTIGGFGPGSGSWDYHSLMISSNSAHTIIRFKASASSTGFGDIAIDYVRVLPLCVGKPSAGNVAPVTPCSNNDFRLALQQSAQTGGLTYLWQDSISGQAGWTSSGISNATQVNATANIPQATWFRCIVACTNSGLADTTPAYFAALAPFYYCYCNSYANNINIGATLNIGRMTLRNNLTGDTLLDNGPGMPVYNFTPMTGYSDFRYTVSAAPVYRDSTFKLSAQEVVSSSVGYTGRIYAFIDYNRDGIFQSTEMVYYGIPSTTTTPPLMAAGSFIVPSTAQIGLTGMRVIIASGSASTFNPCNAYGYGETEDYLLDIRYAPCDGPVNPGVAVSSDTAICPGYSFMLMDTTHEQYHSSIVWNWQQSTNQGSTWVTIQGSAGRDSILQVLNGTTWYRVQMICTATNDTTYSNIVRVREKTSYQCYCYSEATGGTADHSDIGAFSIGNFVINSGGPHVKNPRATKGHADYTSLGPIELYEDSSYAIMIGQILHVAQHQNARATLFMDFNNNLVYDIPSERIALSNDVTSATGWFLIDSVKIPSNLMVNVPTGMRVILNDDTAANIPSDFGCGPYVSGETEDYVVIFRKANPLAINDASLIRELVLYPNPSGGQFTLSLKAAKEIRDLKISVTNIAGQQLLQEHFSYPGSSFVRAFDFSGQPKGLYFVTLSADGERVIRKLVIH